ncbi:acyl-CoA--6-aminopenicillanic acid acyl-transferase [Kushneria pakistanensis]|uniref:Acyl-CoA--6-aminopenicillanic acid acyl-transferase n=1 Tax=Kushneria pakistanensis TaxID=1508770 RepID=A0ABQ3FBX8_9GAMM|nr:C45 family peptidase [Kushneria pakistanensis]GHC17308.1 acyl-CoA--6-aminopenicillanic acid acyl-transferase [Kushneria pakistanensis]
MVKHIDVRGTHFEIGEAHGRQAASEIAISLATYRRMFQNMAGLDWATARHDAERFKAAIEHVCPELLEEMAGIAHGANIDPLDVLVLNARSEIALTHAGGPIQPDGCSALAQHDVTTGVQWLAQNWDWKASQRDALICMTLRAPDKPAITMVTEAGIIGKIGFNEYGVGVCLNALRSQICKPRLPIHVMLRRVLESDSVEHALDMIDEVGVASPAHFLIADGSGHAAGVEVSPMGDSAMAPRHGRLCHTNHLIARHLPPGLEDFPREDSFTRLERLRELVAESEPSFATLRAHLSDEQGAPDGINRRTNPDVAESEQMETLFTIVMNLTERRAELSLGKPADQPEIIKLSL